MISAISGWHMPWVEPDLGAVVFGRIESAEHQRGMCLPLLDGIWILDLRELQVRFLVQFGPRNTCVEATEAAVARGLRTEIDW
jgi:hypothetical protein